MIRAQGTAPRLHASQNTDRNVICYLSFAEDLPLIWRPKCFQMNEGMNEDSEEVFMGGNLSAQGL